MALEKVNGKFRRIFYVRSIHLNSEQCVCETSGSRNINQLDGGDLLSSFSAYSVCINTSSGYERKKKEKKDMKTEKKNVLVFVLIRRSTAFIFPSSTNIFEEMPREKK